MRRRREGHATSTKLSRVTSGDARERPTIGFELIKALVPAPAFSDCQPAARHRASGAVTRRAVERLYRTVLRLRADTSWSEGTRYGTCGHGTRVTLATPRRPGDFLPTEPRRARRHVDSPALLHERSMDDCRYVYQEHRSRSDGRGPQRRSCRREQPTGPRGRPTGHSDRDRADGRGLAGPRAELESTREEAVQTARVYPGGGRSDGRGLAGPRTELEPSREETVQTVAAHRPTGPTDGALGQRPCRRARPSGAPGGARVYPGGGRSDGRGLAGLRAELESTREEAVHAGETYGGPGRS
ncbi:hypothetical protein PoB_005351900 [Plakobranchus ocellatus]|uniref:Uncharacterized protein n=1 Tax=Plakobranchus ocellatus TaxID=259542 RepID=A0AAV4C8I2_9GAST|nr:hypothetical protein PoB_005351900 [Plakobranchus ocellatus]